MLARDYRRHLVEFPCIIQPKLNGIRCLISPAGRAYNKFGSEFEILRGQFPNPSDYWLDGELLHSSKTHLQDVASALNRNEATGDTAMLHLVAFDIVDHQLPQEQRLAALNRINFTGLPINKIRSKRISTFKELDNAFKTWGGEGIIIRYPDSFYVYGKSFALLKRKHTTDCEFPCVGVVAGKGKHTGRLGALVLRTAGGREFRCGGGFEDSHREAFWANPPIGASVTVRFPYLSKQGVPQQSQFIAVRNYEQHS